MVMPSLQDVSREWDQEEQVRQHVRAEKTLLIWENPSKQKISINNGGLNFLVLKPIVRRLLDSSGDVGMHSIGEIESQKLERRFIAFSCICRIKQQCVLLTWDPFILAFRHWGTIISSSPTHLSQHPRIKLLFATMQIAIPRKDQVKKEAKAIKSFLVLIKKKLSRQQVCRNRNFRQLLALVFDPDEKELVVYS